MIKNRYQVFTLTFTIQVTCQRGDRKIVQALLNADLASKLAVPVKIAKKLQFLVATQMGKTSLRYQGQFQHESDRASYPILGF